MVIQVEFADGVGYGQRGVRRKVLGSCFFEDLVGICDSFCESVMSQAVYAIFAPV